ncbi:hypothetical protein ACWGB8_12725 [Kitasatospora sp. NPDC054939]
MTKRALALVLAGTMAGAAAALTVPALADSRTPDGGPRAGRSAPIPAVIIDSAFRTSLGGAPQEVGNVFATRAGLTDDEGAAAGTAYSTCTKVETGPDRVLCHTLLKLGPENQVSLSVLVPTGDGAPKEFDGSVTGGAYAYSGASGTAHFRLESHGSYDLSMG